MIHPFSPIGGTVNVSATTSSSRVALTLGGNSLVVYNSAASIAFVKLGSSTVDAATATSVPIAAGSTRVFALGSETHAAAILASGTGTVYFTTGNGV